MTREIGQRVKGLENEQGLLWGEVRALRDRITRGWGATLKVILRPPGNVSIADGRHVAPETSGQANLGTVSLPFGAVYANSFVGGGGVLVPSATAQNQMIIASATPDWALLAAPSAQHQILQTGASPYTPAWTARFDATVPNIIQPDDAAATGSAMVPVRRDHEHGIVCAAPASPSVSLAASTEGTGTSFARADHAHQLDQAITPSWTGRHTFRDSIVFTHPDSAQNYIIIPDNMACALRIFDSMALEYLRIITTNAQPVIVFNEGGADVDFRVEASGQPNTLFVQGSTGNIGGKTNAPAADIHIVGGTVANKHYSAFTTQILERGNVALQLISMDSTTIMAHVILTGAPASGDNKHWVISHFGPDVNNRFSIGYKTSSANNFGLSDVNEHFVILTAGNVGVGTPTPATSALLDLTSTIGALLLTRMTTTQRDALTAVNGMIVYNSTTNAFNFYENGSWVTK